MLGSFGLVLILFSLLVDIAHRWAIAGFNTLDEAWLQFVRLSGVLGLAWCAVAVARRLLVDGAVQTAPLPAAYRPPSDIAATSNPLQPEHSQDIETIRESGLFDTEWYRATYLQRQDHFTNPLEHFVRFGNEGYFNPNPFFDTSWYLKHNEDVRGSGMIPLLHYIYDGASEGRSAGPKFDTAYYLAENRDVAGDGINPLLHFITEGKAEGRAGVRPETEHGIISTPAFKRYCKTRDNAWLPATQESDDWRRCGLWAVRGSVVSISSAYKRGPHFWRGYLLRVADADDEPIVSGAHNGTSRRSRRGQGIIETCLGFIAIRANAAFSSFREGDSTAR